ncbi:Malonate--CoA ligase [Camellia lanceoleosa]|uniref:Malonate--CoA ligase n=1 Tax=Camellia lanceoleosa TaxID=1840588 RepID=A0ACC0HBE0_9ERIC|nr:Malonate--CoA ligase [Camellia lanceoleosa]
MVEFIPKFSVRAIWQRWRESYPKDGTKVDDAIIVFTGVPTMYPRLIQGYEAMDPELQEASASAASKLRLVMSLYEDLVVASVLAKHEWLWPRPLGQELVNRFGQQKMFNYCACFSLYCSF